MASASELIDAKIGASEARTDSKFGQLIARLESIDTRIGHLETQQSELRLDMDRNVDALKNRIWSTGWGVGSFVVGSMIAIVALVVTVAPYAFDKGQDNARAIHAEITQQITAELARR